MPFLIAYPRESQEMVFDAHDEAFAHFGGACVRGIHDNMSTAVDAILIGKERRFNARFERMCSHHLVEPTACSPASGWEKGQVENQVKLSRQRYFTPRLRVHDYAELNAVLHERVPAHAGSARHPEFKDRTVLQIFEEERAALVTLQGPFRGFHEITAAVSKTCLVTFDRNRYSVSATAKRGVRCSCAPTRPESCSCKTARSSASMTVSLDVTGRSTTPGIMCQFLNANLAL